MNIDGKLVLHESVDLIPCAELAEEVRLRIVDDPTDWVITKRRSRLPSVAIDNSFARLLSEFRVPSSIVEAIVRYSIAETADPDTALNESYGAVQRMIRRGFLVPAEQDRAEQPAHLLKLDSSFCGVTLRRRIQVLDDSEVLYGEEPSGRQVVVKYTATSNLPMCDLLAHEASMLEELRGTRSPQLVRFVQDDLRAAVISEWISGPSIGDWVGRARSLEAPAERRRIPELFRDVLNAYGDLHELGIVHGDVHPRNILIEPPGRVRIIDFGLAFRLSSNYPRSPRRGVAYYTDPDTARADLAGRSVVLNERSEQYSVAAMLYRLWTGAHYVEFELEREAMLQQIVDGEPLAFSARNAPPWPELEATLRRALSKDSYARFPTLRDAAASITDRRPPVKLRKPAPSDLATDASAGALVDEALARFELSSSRLREEPPCKPVASVNFGAGGVAYTLYRVARNRSSAELLSCADVWSERGLRLASRPDAFVDPDSDITLDDVGRGSLFHSVAGLWCVRALVSIAMGDPDTTLGAMDEYVNFIDRAHRDHHDVALGRAGLLLGCSELLEALPNPWIIDTNHILAAGHRLADEVAIALGPGEVPLSRGEPLGMAHGTGGLVFSLLRWALVTGGPVDEAVVRHLEKVCAQAITGKRLIRWPIHAMGSSRHYMDGWCNGTAGHVMLLALADRVLNDDRYGTLALRAADGLRHLELPVGTMCCGLSGVAYALLAAARVSDDPTWIDAARQTAERASRDRSSWEFRESLYKGALGAVLAVEDCRWPEHAAMPLFEPTM